MKSIQYKTLHVIDSECTHSKTVKTLTLFGLAIYSKTTGQKQALTLKQ